MAKRDNHYDAAFEAYLRAQGIPYVAVDEVHRSPGGRETSAAEIATLKSVDFIVSPRDTVHRWLVDVKGRQFPSGKRHKQFWRNWSTADELESLSRWETLFGNRFAALLVFAYWVTEDRSPLPPEQLFFFRERLYGFVGIRLNHYLSFGRPISPKWNTLAMPTEKFRSLARPIETYLQASKETSRPLPS